MSSLSDRPCHVSRQHPRRRSGTCAARAAAAPSRSSSPRWTRSRRTLASTTEPRGTVTQPVVVSGQPPSGFSCLRWLGPVRRAASTAGFVVVLVLFMLLEREELRDRLIGLIGHGHLAVTTKAFDEAGEPGEPSVAAADARERDLRRASARPASGCSACRTRSSGAPSAPALRFIPYIGPVIASVRPDSHQPRGAARLDAPSRSRRLLRPARAVHEPRARDRAVCRRRGSVAGRSARGGGLLDLVVGTAGLLMATPLTVCLVVLGKHVPGLEFVATCCRIAPALAPEYGYYQRLLARDVAEAADLIDRFVKSQPAENGLRRAPGSGAELRGTRPTRGPARYRTTSRRLCDATRELMIDGPLASDLVGASIEPTKPSRRRKRQLRADSIARSRLRGQWRRRQPRAGDAEAPAWPGCRLLSSSGGTRLLAADSSPWCGQQNYDVVCIADLPPSPPSKTRYLVRRLTPRFPTFASSLADGRRPALADDTLQPLVTPERRIVVARRCSRPGISSPSSRIAAPSPARSRERRVRLQTRDSPRLTHFDSFSPARPNSTVARRSSRLRRARPPASAVTSCWTTARDRSRVSFSASVEMAIFRSFAKSFARKPGL